MKNEAAATGRHTRFSQIRRPETPERRARIDSIKAAMDEGERLHELRKEQGVTQIEVAERLGVSQGSVSELERREDVYLSTLRSYVEALGGRLEISAVFDGNQRRTIGLAQGRGMMQRSGSSPGHVRTSRAASKADKSST